MTDKRELQYRQLGLTIAYYRKLRDMTQLQLAESAGISRTHISNIEAQHPITSFSLNTLFSIADALEVPPGKLFELRP